MNKTFENSRLNAHSDAQTIPLPGVEDALDSLFRPVKPRPEFVASLQTSLSDPRRIRPYRVLSSRDIILIAFTFTSILVIAATALKLLIDFITNAADTSSKKPD